MKKLFLLLLVTANSVYPQIWIPDDIIISDSTIGYIDPEFMLYQDSVFTTYALGNGNILIGTINPSNGQFYSNYGRNIFVDRPWAKISVMTNGPEFGLGASGPVMYYTKLKPNGKTAIYKSDYPFKVGSFSEIQLDSNYSYAGACGSIYTNYSTPYLWMYRGKLTDDKSKWQPGQVKNAWFNSSNKATKEINKFPITTIRWTHNSPYITYSNEVNSVKQIFILNTELNRYEQATFDSKDKNDPWGFFAPEYDNEFCLIANIDNKYIRIYRKINAKWCAVDSLSLPPKNNSDTLLTSVEPIYGGMGFDGNSYFTVQAYNNDNKFTSIWLLGLGNKLQRRLDEGSRSGRLMERYDPESIICNNEIYVYYTEQNNTSRIRRCKTGLNNNSIEIYRNISYHKIEGINENLLSLDIYKPASGSIKKPVMIYVHGGYWNAGDKYFVGDKARLFTDSNYVFVSVNYRLSPNPPDTLNTNRIKFPAHPKDLAKAIKWIHTNIELYNGDKENIFLIGHSAGAHLVLLLSTNKNFLEEEGISLKTLKGTCALDCGVFDVEEEINQASNIPERLIPLINAFGSDKNLWLLASPQRQISTGINYPPILLVYQNTNDRVYSNMKFIDSMDAIGNRKIFSFNAYPYDHAEINGMLGSNKDYWGETKTVMAFFRSCNSSLTRLKEKKHLPSQFILSQNYPNPFNPKTVISYQISASNHVCLKVFDVLGRPVATLVDEYQMPGTYHSDFTIDNSQLSSGVYFYQLKAGRFVQTKKMAVLQ